MIALALLWGAAEASLFVVVPDVLIGWIALRRGLRAGLVASLAAAAGAGAGAAAMVAWASADPAGARTAVLALPAIDTAMMGGLRDRMDLLGPAPGLLLAAVTGVPLKIGTVLLPSFGWGWLEAGLVVPLLRLPRFLGTALLAALLRRMPAPARARALAYAGFWLLFYGWYWTEGWRTGA